MVSFGTPVSLGGNIMFMTLSIGSSKCLVPPEDLSELFKVLVKRLREVHEFVEEDICHKINLVVSIVGKSTFNEDEFSKA